MSSPASSTTNLQSKTRLEWFQETFSREKAFKWLKKTLTSQSGGLFNYLVNHLLNPFVLKPIATITGLRWITNNVLSPYVLTPLHEWVVTPTSELLSPYITPLWKSAKRVDKWLGSAVLDELKLIVLPYKNVTSLAPGFNNLFRAAFWSGFAAKKLQTRADVIDLVRLRSKISVSTFTTKEQPVTTTKKADFYVQKFNPLRIPFVFIRFFRHLIYKLTDLVTLPIVNFYNQPGSTWDSWLEDFKSSSALGKAGYGFLMVSSSVVLSIPYMLATGAKVATVVLSAPLEVPTFALSKTSSFVFSSLVLGISWIINKANEAIVGKGERAASEKSDDDENSVNSFQSSYRNSINQGESASDSQCVSTNEGDNAECHTPRATGRDSDFSYTGSCLSWGSNSGFWSDRLSTASTISNEEDEAIKRSDYQRISLSSEQ